MANESTAVYPTANSFVDKTAAGTFIPEIWSDEIIAAYQKNLKMAPLVKKLVMSGKKVTSFTSLSLLVVLLLQKPKPLQ